MTDFFHLMALGTRARSCAAAGTAVLLNWKAAAEALELWGVAKFRPEGPEPGEPALRASLVGQLRAHEDALRAALAAAKALRESLECAETKGGPSA